MITVDDTFLTADDACITADGGSVCAYITKPVADIESYTILISVASLPIQLGVYTP